MYLLDTNACIDFLLGRSDKLADRLTENFGHLGVTTISVAELRAGSARSSDLAGDSRRLDAFLASLAVFPFDTAAAEIYGRTVRRIGVRRGSFERLIAAQAVALNVPVVTRSAKDFTAISGVRTEDWTK